mgnify:CR=1 FL=1
MTDTALAKAAGAWRSIDWRGFLLLIPPPLFWAGNFIVGRAVRQEVPPFTFMPAVIVTKENAAETAPQFLDGTDAAMPAQ